MKTAKEWSQQLKQLSGVMKSLSLPKISAASAVQTHFHPMLFHLDISCLVSAGVLADRCKDKVIRADP